MRASRGCGQEACQLRKATLVAGEMLRSGSRRWILFPRTRSPCWAFAFEGPRAPVPRVSPQGLLVVIQVQRKRRHLRAALPGCLIYSKPPFSSGTSLFSFSAQPPLSADAGCWYWSYLVALWWWWWWRLFFFFFPRSSHLWVPRCDVWGERQPGTGRQSRGGETSDTGRWSSLALGNEGGGVVTRSPVLSVPALLHDEACEGQEGRGPSPALVGARREGVRGRGTRGSLCQRPSDTGAAPASSVVHTGE